MNTGTDLLGRLQPYRFSIVLSVTVLSLYPVWHWMLLRMFSQGGEPWSVLPLGTAVALLWLRPAVLTESRACPSASLDLLIPALLMLLYMVSLLFFPPIFRAALAMLMIANLLSRHWYGKELHLPLFCLLGLALPAVASLQFYLGYPLRVIVGEISSTLLSMNGLVVVRDGTVLQWGMHNISIDAPCSGIKLLWVSLYMVFTLACFFELNAKRTLLLLSVSLVLVLVGNVLRTTALFYTESGLVPAQDWMHEGIGMAVFVLVALGLLLANKFLNQMAHNRHRGMAW
ncbi:MAG: exosortase/archaeosortase family protein [Gammaproteobacteria bacterium]|nr:exosortase/archaeosortase family protein [Gammaproteobacteria bacterium]MDH5801699.1 exosortase/archaeosortase family protein [Gammaproteobacteria bacterium]